jgi:indole-3-glycerol phosphate synthase
MNILNQLAEHARERVEADRSTVPQEALQERCAELGPGNGTAFTQALKRPGLSFICEVKKASPSKGIIAEEFPYVRIAEEYENAGADAISCLTEPKWFLGSDRIFREIRESVKTPMLRKDFTVSAYQIWQARAMGANAVLLICAILGEKELTEYLGLCRELGLAALTETHDEAEIAKAVRCGAEIIGVNNRNLKDFSVNVANAERLRDKVPAGCLYVAESGVTGPEDAERIRRSGADAALVGEALMRAADKAAMLAALRRPL